MSIDQENVQEDNKQTKPHSEELISQLEHVLKSFQRLDGEIKFSSRDLQNRLNGLHEHMKKWTQSIETFNEDLGHQITTLSQETTILTALPEKIGHQLHFLIPEIANHIEQKLFGKLEAAIAKQEESLVKLNERTELTFNKINQLQQGNFRKKLLQTVLSLALTITLSTISTYYLMKPFPKTITINSKGDIEISGGNISVWEFSKNKTAGSTKNRTH